MNILPPAQNPIVIGHDEALREIESAFTSGRMPHAWLITGIEGIGKATLTYHIARYALADGQIAIGKMDEAHPTARLVAAEAHPDLFVLRRSTDEKTGRLRDGIPADDARQLAPFLHLTAVQGNWRAAIIDEAQHLNRFGQNAILKAIEEPPPRSLILITATTPGNLLPTIRSRCRHLPLAPLNQAALRVILTRAGASTEERVVALAGGSAGFALKIIQTDILPLYDEMIALLTALPAWDIPKVQALADKIGRKADTESFDVLTELLLGGLRRAIHAKAHNDATGDLAFLAERLPLDRLMAMTDETAGILARAESANLDPKLAFINAMTALRRGG